MEVDGELEFFYYFGIMFLIFLIPFLKILETSYTFSIKTPIYFEILKFQGCYFKVKLVLYLNTLSFKTLTLNLNFQSC